MNVERCDHERTISAGECEARAAEERWRRVVGMTFQLGSERRDGEITQRELEQRIRRNDTGERRRRG